jgi:hypothetical protein
MQSTKYLLISIGLVLMVFSSIKFYNQPLPPNSGLMLRIYDYLHGIEYSNENTNKGESGDKIDIDWPYGRNYYRLSGIKGKYFYTLDYFDATGEETVSVQERKMYLDFERRLAVLESTKQNMSIWIEIFVATATLLILLNIGLSVWQVGSIARREVETSIKEYDEKFDGFLTSGVEIINKKLADYDSKLEALKEKINELNLKAGKNLDLTNEKISAFRKEADGLLEKFRTESQDIKSNILNELQAYHSKQMQALAEKEKNKDS